VTKIIPMTIMSFVIPEAGAKHKLLFNKPASGFIEHLSLTYEAQQSVTKIVSVTIMTYIAPEAGVKCKLLFDKLASGFVEHLSLMKHNKV
jgi:hypothetical protein